MARILWSIMWSLGEFAAAAPVADELMRRGHTVGFASTEAAGAVIRDHGFGFVADRHTPAYDWSRRTRAPALADEPTDAFMRWNWRTMREQVKDVVRAVSVAQADIVIADPLLVGSGLGAEGLQIPWASYVSYFFDDRMPALAEGRFAAWAAVRRSCGLGPEGRPESEGRWFNLSPLLTVLAGLAGLREWRTPLPGYVHEVGPVMWEPALDSSLAPWLETLGRTRPAVLCATSSLWMRDIDLLRLAGDAFADSGWDVIATVPSVHELPDLPDNVQVFPYFPHCHLVGKVKAIVCSGGLGTVTRAILAGIVPVIVPRGSDHFLVAGAAVRSGVACHVDWRTASVKLLRDMVERSMVDESLRSAVTQMRAASDPVGAVTRAADLIEGLLRSTGR